MPKYPTKLVKPEISDIVLPSGFICETYGGFYNSFVFYLEKPDFKNQINFPKPSNAPVLNEYLNKKLKLELQYGQKKDRLIQQYDLFPVKCNGLERICMIGSTRSDTHSERTVYLMDEQFNVLDQVEIYGSYFQYFVSAKFRDRLWIQTGDGGNGGYLVFYEIQFLEEKVSKKLIGEGSDDQYETYLLKDTSTNPRAIIYKTKPPTINIYNPIAYIIYPPLILFNLSYVSEAISWQKSIPAILLFVCLLLLWLFARKKIKTHLSYIRKTFLSLFRKHPHD